MRWPLTVRNNSLLAYLSYKPKDHFLKVDLLTIPLSEDKHVPSFFSFFFFFFFWPGTLHRRSILANFKPDLMQNHLP